MAEATFEQKECITTLAGPLDISAGAGSGKTYTLTQRIVYALKSPESEVQDIDQVLAITFTNKAAEELKARVRKLLRLNDMNDQALKVDSAWISTIHGMCSRILKANALELGIDPEFSVLSEKDAQKLLTEAIDEVIGDGSTNTLSHDLRELFENYPIRSQMGYQPSITSMLESLLGAAARSPGGFDDIYCGPPSSPASELAYELLASYQEILPQYAEQNQTKTIMSSQEQVEASIEALQSFLDSGSNDIKEFCELLNTFKLLGASVSKAFKEEVIAQRTIHSSVARKALVGYGAIILDQLMQIASRVEQVFLDNKRRAGYLDNDDLIKLTLRAFENQTVRDRYKDAFKLVMVDEFQDTDRLQLEIIKHLAGPGLRYLCTVGDAQQSIYRFRGADVNAYRAFRDSLENPEIIEAGGRPRRLALTKNFRSHRDILEFVKLTCAQEQVFGENFLDLQAEYSGEKYRSTLPRVKVGAICKPPKYPGPLSEIDVLAEQVADYFEEMQQAGHALSDMVLLLRRMGNAEVFAKAIREKGYSCVIAGGSIFAEASEVGVVKNLARAIVNPKDWDAMVRLLSSEMLCLSADDLLVLSSGIDHETGELKQQELYEGIRMLSYNAPGTWLTPSLKQAVDLIVRAQDQLRFTPLSKVVQDTLVASGWLARLESEGSEGLAIVGNILKAVRCIESIEQETHCGPATAINEFCAMLSSMKESPGSLAIEDQDAIRIMTIHSSKGLEFPIVALADFGGAVESNAGLLIDQVGSSTFATFTPWGGDFAASEPLVKASFDQPYSGDIAERENDLRETVNLEMYRESVKLSVNRESAAEHQRLFYVAATRAKEALFVAMTIKEKVTSPLSAYYGVQEDIRSALFELDEIPQENKRVDLGSTVEGLEFQYIPLLAENPDGKVELSVEVKIHRGLLGAVLAPEVDRYFMPKYLTLAQKSRGIVSYSSLAAASQNAGHENEKEVLVEDELFHDAEKPLVDADKATDFGSAFHRLAQLAALRSGDEARTHLEAIAQTYGVVDRARLAKAFENWLASSTFEQAMGHDHHRPEVPFCITVGDVYLEGEIDLLCHNQQSDQAFVVDYKTGGHSDETSDSLQEKHRLQAQCYAYALLRSGFNQVDLVFARVEQEQNNDIQTVSYTFNQADKKALHATIAAKI